MQNLDALKKSYPRYVIVLFLNWLLYTNIPFLGSFRKYFILVEIIAIVPLFISSNYRQIPLKNQIKANIPFGIFLGICILASLFTRSLFNRDMLATLILIFTTFIFIESSSKNDKKKLVDNIYTSLNVITIVSFIGILIVLLTDIENSSNPTISYTMGNFVHGRRFYGVTNNCNALGPMAAFAVYMAIFKLQENKNNWKGFTLHLVILLINAYIMWGTRSLTALAAFIVGIITMPICMIRKHRKISLLALILIVILLITLFMINIDYLSILLDKDLRTATDRTLVWKNCIEIINNRPLTGFGTFEKYQAFAQSNNIEMHVAGAHNQYLEIALLYGYPAMILYISGLVLALYRILKCFLTDKKMTDMSILLPIMILFFGITHSIMEGQVIFAHNPNMVIFLTAYIMLNNKLMEIETVKK